jgi:methyl-accepting chemotaxis protein
MIFRLGAGLRAAMWAARLEDTSRDLGNLARETEGEILGLGSRLEEFAQVAGKVSQQAAGVVEAVQGSDQMAKASDIFSSACERLLTSNGEIASGLERLAAVEERLRGLFRFQRSLNHLTRTVRMLRVATRMETARLHDERDELSMLADEIDKFSQRLDSHVGGFFDQAAEVAAETARLVAGLEVDRRAYKVRLDEAEGATQSALEQLTAILGQAAELSEMTSRRARDVVREVSEIVASLQFHDITRQQIDHVQTALAEANSHLRGLAKGRLLRRWGRKAQAGLVRRVLMLQASQLRQVRQEISESGRRVIDSLAGIAEGCQAQANDLAPIGGRDAEKCGLGQLEEQMATLAEILEQGSKLSRRMFDSTRAAAALLDKMEGSLHAIQSINEELNLLALNALVKVSRQAGGGRALAEVAQEVNRLSLEPRETIVQAAEEVKGLLAEARELNTLQETALAENHRQSEAVARAAEDALQGLRRLGQDVNGAVGRLVSDSERLVYDINAVVSVVRFHRVVATRVDAALEVLEECGRALPGAGARESAPAELNLESGRLGALERHYTMESERQVHRKIISRAAPRAAAAPATGGGGSAEFGENVELF